MVRAARADGPQVVTRHGEAIAVVVDIDEYRRLKGETVDFKDYLRIGPSFDDLELTRVREFPRSIDWAAEQ